MNLTKENEIPIKRPQSATENSPPDDVTAAENQQLRRSSDPTNFVINEKVPNQDYQRGLSLWSDQGSDMGPVQGMIDFTPGRGYFTGGHAHCVGRAIL